MDQIANPAPGFQSNPGKVITVEPYRVPWSCVPAIR